VATACATSGQSNLTKRPHRRCTRTVRSYFARWRQRAATSNTCFLRPTGVHIPNGISIGSAVFAQLTAEGPYTWQWTTPPPSKLPLSMGDLDSMVPWAHPSPWPKWHLDHFSCFCRAHDRDRPRQTTLLRWTIGRIYVVLQYGLKRGKICSRIISMTIRKWIWSW